MSVRTRHRHVTVSRHAWRGRPRLPEVAHSGARTGSAALTCDRFPVCAVLRILRGHVAFNCML